MFRSYYVILNNLYPFTYNIGAKELFQFHIINTLNWSFIGENDVMKQISRL